MTDNKNIGWIECGVLDGTILFDQLKNNKGYSLKKVMVTDPTSVNRIKSDYPTVEIVHEEKAILEDTTIQLIIISAPQAKDKNLLGEVVRSGKHVQVL